MSGGRTRSIRRAEARRPNGLARRSRGRYPPRRKAGVTVSRYERGAFRRNDRTATEVRVRSPSLGNQLKRLMYRFCRPNRSVERDSNPRPHDWKIMCSPTELSSRLVEMTGIEPVPPGFPGALHEPHPLPSFSGTRTRRAHRASQANKAWTQGVPKERGRVKVKQGGKKAEFQRSKLDRRFQEPRKRRRVQANSRSRLVNVAIPPAAAPAPAPSRRR